MINMLLDSDHKNHGKLAGYADGCRCDRCKAAVRDYHRDYLARNPDQAEKQRRRAQKRRENNGQS